MTAPRFAIAALLGTLAVATATADPVADRVYGQPDLYSYIQANPAMPTNARIQKGRSVAVTKDGVYVGDDGMSRILFFPHGKTEATRVYGQADFSGALQNFRGLSADSLAMQGGLGASDAGLAVADYRNARALYYPPNQTTATIVFGQPHFESTVPTFYPDPYAALKYPYAATIDDNGGVYVADSMEGRICYYPPGQKVAERIYSSAGTGTVRGLGSMEGLAVDDKGLYVADTSNNRVLFFPHGSMVATRVYGQPGFDTNQPNYGGISANSLNQPWGVASDGEGVYIADSYNYRVLYYPGESSTASVVYGQASFSASQYAFDPTRVGVPLGVASDGTAVYVADSNGGRVLRFPKYNAPVANRLEFSVAPSDGRQDEPLATQPAVRVLMADGQLAADYSGPVILSLVPGVGTACASLQGETTVQAVAGVATFTNVSVDAPGTFRLEAQAGTLTGAQSASITIEANPKPELPGDFNHDGQVNLADTVLGMRVLAGLDTF